MSTPILEVRDVRKRYGHFVALHGISFQVQPGDMFGLLGPNGAGKTTLLSIISALLPATSGEVLIQGRQLTRASADLRQLIGIVPQELALYSELTARENVIFLGRLYGLVGERLRKRANEVLEAVALQDHADQRVDSFSGGMKRRLNLGASLIHQPTLLLLDEPTTGVDPQSRHHIFNEIRRVNREGVTVVYTSHYMEEVQTLCRRVGIIDHGRLIACDDLTNLLHLLPGVVRLRLQQITPTVRERLAQLPAVDKLAGDDSELLLTCRDARAALPALLAALKDLNATLLSLDLEEPSLERVFLSLTGSALRD